MLAGDLACSRAMSVVIFSSRCFSIKGDDVGKGVEKLGIEDEDDDEDEDE